ncbi:related to acetylhydrolase [Ramularia collo-cygni]|uniref:Putative phospholipase n=1 Tax=Ramularia collo-cygni TaxID=112498 RepID=A0A2D3VJN8_9PEZI|nr:related to acetylhydrolase [Ramularia collo-cygni]CZT25787.1 related to acetylhydrolase [Ramularia collo-cygni]
MALHLRFRPRWSVKYVLCSAISIYILAHLLLDMPLLSSKLPNPTGSFNVGTIDIEVPCESRQTPKVVDQEGERAFEVSTVLFSLFYPTNKDAVSKTHHPWVPKPLSLKGEGYARFAKVNNFLTNGIFTFGLWSLVGSTEIPANVDTPIHGTVKTYIDYEAEHPLDGDYGRPKFPVIVFSHGMAGSRTDYSAYCSELASRGIVVAAIEHRDGSAPASVIMREKMKPRRRFHLTPEMLSPQPETPEFKVMQLTMRQAEVEETVRVLRMLNDGRGGEVFRANTRLEGRDLAEWRGRLDTNKFLIGGHSYGATLALQVLKGAPSEALPFVGGIMFDPGKQSGPLNDDVGVPVVVVHSQSWSAKHSIFDHRPHFSVVKDLVRKIIEERKQFAWFVTAKGTTHPSVTDAPLIEPFLLSWTTGSTINAHEAVLQYVKITEQLVDFLRAGHRHSILREEITHPEYDESARDYDASLSKYWQIHMAPTTACPAPGLCGLDDD